MTGLRRKTGVSLEVISRKTGMDVAAHWEAVFAN